MFDDIPEGLRVPAISRRRLLQLGALGIGAFSAAPLLAACGSTSSQAAPGGTKKGGDLVIVRDHDAVNMDKTTVFSNASIWTYNQIYEPLVAMTDDGQGVKPWLAESYEMAPDNLSCTLKLRQGVKFHNGQPMTSADVKFSIDESSKTKGGWEFINSAIKEVTTPDDYTVVVTTKYPWAPLLADLSCPNNGIIPKDYAGKTKDEFYANPIGTGPFVWATWQKGSALTLKKNPSYWQAGKPHLDSVTWKVVADSNARAIQLQGGQAHINEAPPFSSLAQLKGTPNVKVDLFPSTKTDYIMMNQTKKPFDDVHVRRAISYAVDREALVKSILFGNGTPANSFMMPSTPYYDKNTPGLQYDMAKAKEELAQSSVPNGFTTTWLAMSGDAVDAAIAQVLQASLKELGITLNIQNVDPSAQHDLTGKLDYEIAHSYWTMDLADPDELAQFALDPTTGGHSFDTGMNDASLIDLVHKAQKEFDKTKRQALYTELQTKAAESAFLVFLFYTPFPYATTSNVQGFNVLPTGSYHLEDVSL
ncbi:glutathione ABC transporter substrate-binding protein [Planotetraspora thailandica]|uniref:Glutathione ABC transporter substrate-binding protein n=1 Tax=Planotetraspora thailandica TaxID=487172 RepID=A0A8J3V392_9ACTN|nr:ABC transporter substrate-binding protein [Planotetraspora thailandica]GII55976.1 glutathione ABC transporter substrate-binding protein [Planotetraspora thailandica]